VTDHQHAAAFLARGKDDLLQGGRGARIHVVGGLVEEHQLAGQPRQAHTLSNCTVLRSSGRGAGPAAARAARACHGDRRRSAAGSRCRSRASPGAAKGPGPARPDGCPRGGGWLRRRGGRADDGTEDRRLACPLGPAIPTTSPGRPRTTPADHGLGEPGDASWTSISGSLMVARRSPSPSGRCEPGMPGRPL